MGRWEHDSKRSDGGGSRRRGQNGGMEARRLSGRVGAGSGLRGLAFGGEGIGGRYGREGQGRLGVA